ncbi:MULTISPECIES: nucleotidyltransferase domain-containing protein [Dyadobacter]|uniref:Nucleotidyltransferase domain-containing protein n=1 Tax=Dyadobacter chenhuakuii TaxID=2909339 RepID=A0A9X1QG89_9BACT|nr:MULTISPECIES: nucleotidyltransferase domain-containing protein [Dyadobacter]MCF2501150.1 nucleotidyltransferase domain-containing protein [Dyadobacter chenhuakuii]MCF2519423.1 nucleotidyltransferase domain-containing protein [Dyadobacter sp. CY351]
MSTKGIPKEISALSQEFVSKVSQLYGKRLNKVILFGSYARGEQHEESDVDYMVVLNDEEIRSYNEINMLAPISSDLGMKYGFWISAIPYTNNKLFFGETPLGKNVIREGIEL